MRCLGMLGFRWIPALLLCGIVHTVYVPSCTSSEGEMIVAILRHGESEANVQKLIVSRPENGIGKYGLTDIGRMQAEQVDLQILEDKGKQIVIVSSPFLRALYAIHLNKG